MSGNFIYDNNKSNVSTPLTPCLFIVEYIVSKYCHSPPWPYTWFRQIGVSGSKISDEI